MSELGESKARNYNEYLAFKAIVQKQGFTKISQYYKWCYKNKKILEQYLIKTVNIDLHVIHNVRDTEGRIPWISYYEFLGCEYLLDNYPFSVADWREKIVENQIYSQEQYYEYCESHDDMPLYPWDVYKREGFREELYREIYECY